MIVYLYLSSWVGISLGATHYYAELQPSGDRKNVDIMDTLTAKQAAALNKKGVRYYRPFKPGDQYKGFDTKEAAIQAGIEQWRTHFPDGKFLVLGRAGYCEPQPLLATSFLNEAAEAELKAKVQTIIDRCEEIGWFDDPKNDDEMDTLYNQWKGLLKKAQNSEVVAR